MSSLVPIKAITKLELIQSTVKQHMEQMLAHNETNNKNETLTT